MAGKSILEYAIKLKAPSKSISIKHNKRVLTDKEMALPGVTPTAEELEQWITQNDNDKGSSAEVATKRVLKKLRKEFTATNNQAGFQNIYFAYFEPLMA